MVRVVAVVIILIMMMSVYAIAAVIKANGGEKMTLVGRVQMHTISKRIELESPSYLDLKIFQFPSKPEQPGLTSLIRLDVVCI